jgi:hypothetical protein
VDRNRRARGINASPRASGNFRENFAYAGKNRAPARVVVNSQTAPLNPDFAIHRVFPQTGDHISAAQAVLDEARQRIAVNGRKSAATDHGRVVIICQTHAPTGWQPDGLIDLGIVVVPETEQVTIGAKALAQHRHAAEPTGSTTVQQDAQRVQTSRSNDHVRSLNLRIAPGMMVAIFNPITTRPLYPRNAGHFGKVTDSQALLHGRRQIDRVQRGLAAARGAQEPVIPSAVIHLPAFHAMLINYCLGVFRIVRQQVADPGVRRRNSRREIRLIRKTHLRCIRDPVVGHGSNGSHALEHGVIVRRHHRIGYVCAMAFPEILSHGSDVDRRINVAPATNAG